MNIHIIICILNRFKHFVFDSATPLDRVKVPFRAQLLIWLCESGSARKFLGWRSQQQNVGAIFSGRNFQCITLKIALCKTVLLFASDEWALATPLSIFCFRCLFAWFYCSLCIYWLFCLFAVLSCCEYLNI